MAVYFPCDQGRDRRLIERFRCDLVHVSRIAISVSFDAPCYFHFHGILVDQTFANGLCYLLLLYVYIYETFALALGQHIGSLLYT